MMERKRPEPPLIIRMVLPAVLVALYLPLLVMVVESFLESVVSPEAAAASESSWTFRWYKEVLQDPALIGALGRSFLVASLSALSSTAIGLLASLALDRWLFIGRRPLRMMSVISLMMPELVLALSLLSWFALLKVQLSLVTVIIAHITLTVPFVILVISASLRGLDRSYEDAARDLGAGEFQVFLKVTLPLLAPALLSAGLLSFLLSFDDFLVTFFTNGAGSDTLPVRLYSLMRTGLTPKVQALSSLMLLVSFLLILLLIRRRGDRDLFT